MKCSNKFLIYLQNHTIWVILVLILLCLVKLISLELSIILLMFYFVTLVVIFRLTNKNFIIDNEGILLKSLTKEIRYSFSEISEIHFIEKYYLVVEYKKIKLIFHDTRTIQIGCNGIISNDDTYDYPDSFEVIFEYIKANFKNTHLVC